MARMIDADRLLRELTALSHGQVWPGWTYDGIRLLIERQPTLTPPEIVCCQDCVHHEDGYAHWCNKWEHTCPDDSEFFCKFGRKKNDSTTD